MRRRSVAVAAMALAAGGLAACGDGSPSLLDRSGPEADRTASVWWLMFALATVVYVLVAGLVVVAVLRGRRASGPDDRGPSDDAFIWTGGIVVPVLVLALLAVVTVTTTRDLRNRRPGELRIDVAAKRWWWDVRYPEQGVASANEVHVPVGRPVDVALTSDNVVHSFWVPQLAGKVDTVPGQTNHLRFEASRPGVYRGECAEFCGIQHANMGFLVIAETPDEFGRWLTRRSTAAGIEPVSEQAAAGEVVFQREACAGCHTVRGTQAAGRRGPDLTDFGSRRWIAAVAVRNTPANLAHWIGDPDDVKPGTLMPPTALSPQDADALVAYLEGLG